jgi:hypothetical protein
MGLDKQENRLSRDGTIGRRDFIQYGAVMAGGLLLSPLITHADITNSSSPEQLLYWYQKPLRIMHTVLREIDAKNYDAAAVVRYLKKGAYNTLCVNAGGIVDFFQNPLPAGNVNRFMGTRDILKEITTACKEANIKVIARIDFRGAEEHIYEKFPHWFKMDRHQNPVKTTYTKPVLYESCYMGEYRNDYGNEFVRYVMKTYAVDGIWHNAPGVNGICYCDNCKTAYKAVTGEDIPIPESASETQLDSYMSWKERVADNYMERIKQTVKSFGADKAYTAEVFSIYGVGQRIDSGIDIDSARKHFDILVSVAFLTSNERGEESPYEDLKYGSTIIKFLKSMVPDREAVVMYGGNGTSHRLVIDPPQDLKVWLWEILSAGGRFWNCYFTNVPTLSHDNRNAFNETEAYEFVRQNDKLLERHVPVANVGIYYSHATRKSYRKKSEEGDRFGVDIRGIEAVLMESHIPHDFILDNLINRETLSKYKVIFLPNVRNISDREVGMLTQYVREGGNLIATYSTGLYDDKGNERSDYALGEMFGVHYAGKKENTRRDNYQYIVDKNHPVVSADSRETELLFNAGFTALCRPSKNAKVICTWVPTIQNQPPDKAWVEAFSTEFPTVVENVFGQGKVIYFANQPDLLSYTIGHPDPRNLLSRAVRYLLGNPIVVETNAPSSVHIGLTESRSAPGQYLISLVNTTSGPVRPIRELIPVTDIEVNLRLGGKSVKSHKVLRCQGDCRITSKGAALKLQITRLEDFFAASVEMNS